MDYMDYTPMFCLFSTLLYHTGRFCRFSHSFSNLPGFRFFVCHFALPYREVLPLFTQLFPDMPGFCLLVFTSLLPYGEVLPLYIALPISRGSARSFFTLLYHTGKFCHFVTSFADIPRFCSFVFHFTLPYGEVLPLCTQLCWYTKVLLVRFSLYFTIWGSSATFFNLALLICQGAACSFFTLLYHTGILPLRTQLCQYIGVLHFLCVILPCGDVMLNCFWPSV